MPLPSLYSAIEDLQAWSVPHAAGYGAGIGALAAVVKTLGVAHGAGGFYAGALAASEKEIAGVALAFALLCAGAAALRNFLARRLVWRDLR